MASENDRAAVRRDGFGRPAPLRSCFIGRDLSTISVTVDWASRPSESDPTGLEVFAGKVAAVVSASPGALGGMRAQIALQISLNKLGLLVIPNSFALGLAHQAFDEQRRLKDGNADQNVRGVGAALVRTAIALAPTPKRSELGDRGGADSGALAGKPAMPVHSNIRSAL